MTVKLSLKVIVNGVILYATYHYFLLVVCSNRVSILHNFRDVTSFTVYMTASACYSKNSFTFDTGAAVKL